MIEGDGLTLERCAGCGRLSLVILDKGEPAAFVCPPPEALMQLVTVILKHLEAELPIGDETQSPYPPLQ